ncbi:GDSL esterase/lipase [Platanthera guangdongensis]|uniref:GDSL esterase/lipase n=1 Tax=Platanthera guangdongensis TaxID=2320717 RepID=A0ABR2LQ20_9ASPA
MAPIDAAFFFLVLVGLGGSLAAGKAQVPAMFVFGDSLVDPGNNNNLLTLARANFDPNGIDFPVGETGRFCNGGTLIDHLGMSYFSSFFLFFPSKFRICLAERWPSAEITPRSAGSREGLMDISPKKIQ